MCPCGCSMHAVPTCPKLDALVRHPNCLCLLPAPWLYHTCHTSAAELLTDSSVCCHLCQHSTGSPGIFAVFWPGLFTASMLQALQWSQHEDSDAYVLTSTAWEGRIFHDCCCGRCTCVCSMVAYLITVPTRALQLQASAVVALQGLWCGQARGRGARLVKQPGT